MKKTLSKIVQYFIFPLIIAILSIILTCWFNDVYNRPRIEYYSRPYFKIDDFAIGNVYLFNNGKIKDENVSIIFYENIKDEDLKIIDLISNYTIKHNDNKTIVIIEELKPGESADITFRASGDKDDCNMEILSNSSNIYNMFEEPWYYFSLLTQILIIFLSLMLGGFLVIIFHFYKKRQ